MEHSLIAVNGWRLIGNVIAAVVACRSSNQSERRRKRWSGHRNSSAGGIFMKGMTNGEEVEAAVER